MYVDRTTYEKDKRELLAQFAFYKAVANFMNSVDSDLDNKVDFFNKFTDKLVHFVEQSQWSGSTNATASPKTTDTTDNKPKTPRELAQEFNETLKKHDYPYVCAIVDEKQGNPVTLLNGDGKHLVALVAMIIIDIAKFSNQVTPIKFLSEVAMVILNFSDKHS